MAGFFSQIEIGVAWVGDACHLVTEMFPSPNFYSEFCGLIPEINYLYFLQNVKCYVLMLVLFRHYYRVGISG